jgi:hypothetical protein
MGGSSYHNWVFNHGLVRPPPPFPLGHSRLVAEPLRGGVGMWECVCAGGQVGVVSERTVGQAWRSHGRVSRPERRLPEVLEPHPNLGLCVRA